eukprot:UN26491
MEVKNKFDFRYVRPSSTRGGGCSIEDTSAQKVILQYPKDGQNCVNLKQCDIYRLTNNLYMNDSLMDFYMK